MLPDEFGISSTPDLLLMPPDVKKETGVWFGRLDRSYFIDNTGGRYCSLLV